MNAIWKQFHLQHARAHYTPVFNSFLESLIADPTMDLLIRVLAWVLRNSWGRHSSDCVDADGIRIGQSDSARDLGLLDKEGKPDRRKISPVFQTLEKLKLVRFEGRGIYPIDNPGAFAFSSANVGKGSTLGEDRAKLNLRQFIEQIWKESNPKAFEDYQKVELSYKKFRTSILTAYKEYEGMSDRGPTKEEDCPEGGRPDVGQGADNLSDRGRTSPEPILITSLNKEHLNNLVSPIADSKKDPKHEADGETGFRGLLGAADWAEMGVAEGHLYRIRQLWAKMTPSDRMGAIEGIRLRKEAGQYGNPKFTPRLLKYLEDRLWTEKVKEQGQGNKNGADNYLNQLINGVESDGDQRGTQGSGSNYLDQLINGSDRHGD